MPNVFGREYTRDEIEKRVGAMDQLAGIRAAELTDGRARGVRILHVHTGSGLEFTAAVDRCLDIFDFRFNGRSLAWHSGTGVVSPALYEHDGTNWLRCFFGGMITTCGLGNVGAPTEDEGRAYGLHGRIANTPAENVGWGAEWHGDDYVLWIRGEVRDARVFGPRLVLRRHISTSLGSRTVVIEDTVENEGFDEEPFLLLYHSNAGYPLLDDGAEVRVRGEVSAFDDAARADFDNWTRATGPRHGVPEQVFIHDVEEDADGFGQAELVNPALGLGYRIRFRKAELPHLWQWKMMGERDYVMGLEPCNCAPGGRAVARNLGDLGHLPPRGFVTHRIELEALEVGGRSAE